MCCLMSCIYLDVSLDVVQLGKVLEVGEVLVVSQVGRPVFWDIHLVQLHHLFGEVCSEICQLLG